jgi:hypothetical protein
MRKLIAVSAVGFITSAMVLGMPAESRAAHRPFGISVDWGRGGFSYYRGSDCYDQRYYAPQYYSPRYDYGPSYYPSYRDSYYGPSRHHHHRHDCDDGFRFRFRY